MSFTLLGILNSQAAGAVGAGAYDLLETTVLASPAADVTLTGIDSYTDYKHLQVRMVIRSTDVDSTAKGFRAQINGTGTYASHHLSGFGTSVVSGNRTSSSEIIESGLTPSASAPTGEFGVIIFDILDAFDTNKNKTVRFFTGNTQGFGNGLISLRSGFKDSTAAVSSLNFDTESNFDTGSRFSLYGVKG